MQVIKITEEKEITSPRARKITEEELQREYGYYVAQKILGAMRDKGFISVDEFNKITEKNRQTFRPYLAEIMPEMT